MNIEIEEKTGFQTNDRFVRIYDSTGEIFYEKNAKSYPFNFNLPRGKYNTTNDIRYSSIRKYKLPLLPRHERKAGYIPSVNRIKISYVHNPNKATIIRDTNTILLDNSIRDLPRPIRTHILLHEMGHYYYSTEKYCDLWAMREMLKMGFNPSQIHFAVAGELSNSLSSLERKEYIMNACENSFKI